MTMFYNSWIYTIACALVFSTFSLRNMFVEFFSKISYEIYLCQGISIYSLRCIGITNETLGGGNFDNIDFGCFGFRLSLFNRHTISQKFDLFQ